MVTMMNTCPRCGGSLPDPKVAALSRQDNKTKVCSPCGVQEALNAFAGLPVWRTFPERLPAYEA